MAGAGWGQLIDGAGEAVSYDRLSGGSSVTGFPKTVNAVCCVDERNRNQYEDGRGEVESAVFQVRVSVIGSAPQIGNDTITRSDSTVWVLEKILEISAGIATCAFVLYTELSKSSRRSRIER